MQAAANHAEPAWLGHQLGSHTALLPVPLDAGIAEDDFEQIIDYHVTFRHALFGVLADAEMQRERRFSAVLPFESHLLRLCATGESRLDVTAGFATRLGSIGGGG